MVAHHPLGLRKNTSRRVCVDVDACPMDCRYVSELTICEQDVSVCRRCGHTDDAIRWSRRTRTCSVREEASVVELDVLINIREIRLFHKCTACRSCERLDNTVCELCAMFGNTARSWQVYNRVRYRVRCVVCTDEAVSIDGGFTAFSERTP